MRVDGRRPDEIRELRIQRNFIKYAPGSALVEWGDTRVLCTATIEENVPGFLANTGRGWLTSEYAMLPGSTQHRKARDARRGQIEGRTQEIQRLIGRALRAAVRLDEIGERTIWVDCDVLQADGGTRTTAINGAYVAVVDCFRHLVAQRTLKQLPLHGNVAAVSVGMIQGSPHSDLCYEEDIQADVDLNVIMNDKGEFIEIQGGAEGAPFDDAMLSGMIETAKRSIREIVEIQDRVLREI
jgi:ribonuclease PH